MTLDERPLDPQPSDGDLGEHDTLLGTPVRSLFSIGTIRGLGLVGIAVAILLWPERTDRILALLVGVGLAFLAATNAYETVRHHHRRTFWTILSVGLGAGLSAALLVHPEDSLRTSTQLVGAALLGAAAVWSARMVRARRGTPWQVTRTVAALVGGGLLVVFPESMVVAATSLTAAGLAAAGFIQVFSVHVDGDGVSRSLPVGDAVRAWVSRRTSASEDRATLQDKVYFEGPSAPVRYARFAALMGFASVIASFGVVVESTAVVIGAMLVAPLMVPLMGIALAVPMGWARRLRRCAGVAVSGVGIAIATGAIVGASGRGVDVTTNTEVLSRISPTAADLAIAIAAGSAGAYALARRDVSDSLPGVAVAIALVPPLTVVGLCWQQQAWSAGNGALLLFLTNAAAIIVAGGIMFVAVGAAPLRRVREDQERLLTGVVGAFAFAAMVILLLLLNGTQLAQTELARADVDQVLADWSEQHPEHRVEDVQQLGDGTLTIDLVGPERPPELRQLSRDLEDATGGNTPIRLGWSLQQQVLLGD